MTTTDTTQPDATTGDEGRFFLVTGPNAEAVATALAAALPRAATVDGQVVGAMFTPDPDGARADLEQLFLRFTAGIALADSFRLAGFDAVVTEDVPPAYLEDYLDFAEPTPVRLVRLAGSDEPAGGPEVASTVTGGIEIDGTDPQAAVAQIIARADEAIVSTGGDSA